MGWVTGIKGSTSLDCHWKKVGWVGSDNLAYCSGAKAPTPIENYNRVL